MPDKQRNIAYCICTYNHPDVVDEVVGKIIDIFEEYGLDIYVFDSGTDAKTYEIVQGYAAEHGNIFHVRMDEGTSFDEKIRYVMTEYIFPHNYKYIWPVKDRVYIGESMCRRIVEAAQQDYDMIFCNVLSNEKYAPVNGCAGGVYDSAVKFYEDYGWLMTSLDAGIYRRASVRKVIFGDFINECGWHRESCFTHFMLAFYMLSLIEAPQILIVTPEAGEWGSSDKCGSMWTDRTLEIWVGRWYEANVQLPSVYAGSRERVKKAATSLPWIMGTATALVYLHLNGILDKNTVELYGDIWDKVCDIPLEDVRLIARDSYHELADRQVDRIVQLVEKGDIVEAVNTYLDNEWMSATDYKEQYAVLGKELSKLLNA